VDRLRRHVAERLDHLRENLRLWLIGELNPPPGEIDEASERRRVTAALRAAIGELEGVEAVMREESP
jgi:hypothetical protein